jgi:hypothetical protein
MSWNAETNQGQLTRGTVLAVYQSPWGAGLPVRSLPSNVDLIIRFSNGAVATVQVIESTGVEAVLQLGTSQWRMNVVEPKELRFPPPGTGGAPTTYWLVQ